MSLLLPTTTVDVYRSTVQDPTEPPSEALQATHVPATLSTPQGIGVRQQSAVDAAFLVGPTADIQESDRLDDNGTGDTWYVMWVVRHFALGLDYVAVGVNRTRGVVG